MQEKQPWIKLAKEQTAAADATMIWNPRGSSKLIDNCLHVCLQLTANLAMFINPFLPFTAKKCAI